MRVTQLTRWRVFVSPPCRLSTVRDADSIAVVFKGAIVEQGSHEALMARADGSYARLVRHQLQRRGTSARAHSGKGRAL